MTDNVWKPHATVAAIIEQNGCFLLVEELCSGTRVYNQPAGHLEDNESLQDAVVREVREETRFLFAPESLVGCYRWRDTRKNRTHIRMTFCGSVSDEKPEQPLDDGILDTHWLSYEEINQSSALRSPLVLQCINDYRAGHRYPLELLHDVVS